MQSISRMWSITGLQKLFGRKYPIFCFAIFPVRLRSSRLDAQLGRCRNPGEAMVELLERVHPSRLAFVTNTRTLGYYGGRRDLCPLCRQYRTQVEFSVRQLGQSITIRVQSPRSPQRKIGCFQTMEWFIDWQGLSAPFGKADQRDLRSRSCKLCLPTGLYPRLKRQVSGCGEKVSSRKKARPR